MTEAKARGCRLFLIVVLGSLLSLPVWAHSSGGGSSSSGNSSSSSGTPNNFNDNQGGGGAGFGASPKAVAAWEAAGGRRGTGMSFQDWFKKMRTEMATKQDDLDWDADTAGWSASAWNIPYYGAKAADLAGKISQFGLNFVPGVGTLTNIGLDTARGAADGYSQAVDKGLSQSEAAKAGGTTGVASGFFSAFANKFGFAKDAGKAIQASQAARTAAQIARTNKKLGTALGGTAVQEGLKNVIGDQHTSNVVNNWSPQAQVTGD